MRETKNEDLNLELILKTIKDKELVSAGSFAHSFNGYDFGGFFEGRAEISKKVDSAIEEDKAKDLTLSELRTCLFLHYRAAHYTGGPTNEAKVNTLLELIRDRVSKNNID